MHVYIAVSKDKYELPIAVADTASELARMVGVKENAIIASISRTKAGKIKWSRYRKVVFEEETEEPLPVIERIEK